MLDVREEGAQLPRVPEVQDDVLLTQLSDIGGGRRRRDEARLRDGGRLTRRMVGTFFL